MQQQKLRMTRVVVIFLHIAYVAYTCTLTYILHKTMQGAHMALHVTAQCRECCHVALLYVVAPDPM